jgi:UDP-GlcNAc:undecaprenyl-phosphate/decaprenyl-phosphate GlcNAc-1-phosphate transferase
MNNWIELLLFFLASLVGNFLIMKYGYKISLSKGNQTQDIHEGKVSRLGGLILIILFFSYAIDVQIIPLSFLFISLLILFPALLEDFGFSIKPLIRLSAILMGCFLLVINLNYLPPFDLSFLNIVFNNFYFQIIFYTLALSTVINGQNIIDGTNGLSASSGIIIFICIGYLGVEINNLEIIQIAIFIVILLISFLLFNFPSGKIFLGDAGSYFIGLLGGYLIIEIFATNPQLPTWSAVIILIYPSLEVIFSYFRKIYSHQSPFLPDNKHLHLKIFYLLSKGAIKPSRLYNALVTPFLSIIWLSPLAILPISLVLPHLSLIFLAGLVLVYLFFYYSIPNPD